MMNRQQREFSRLGLNVILSAMKLAGQLEWLIEQVQHTGTFQVTGLDAFYDRLATFHDRLDALRRHPTWQCVDVSDDDDLE